MCECKWYRHKLAFVLASQLSSANKVEASTNRHAKKKKKMKKKKKEM